jgi:hypothetical protein
VLRQAAPIPRLFVVNGTKGKKLTLRIEKSLGAPAELVIYTVK